MHAERQFNTEDVERDEGDGEVISSEAASKLFHVQVKCDLIRVKDFDKKENRETAEKGLAFMGWAAGPVEYISQLEYGPGFWVTLLMVLTFFGLVVVGTLVEFLHEYRESLQDPVG